MHRLSQHGLFQALLVRSWSARLALAGHRKSDEQKGYAGEHEQPRHGPPRSEVGLARGPRAGPFP